MTGYEEFVLSPIIKPDEISFVYELEVNKNPSNFLEFTQEYLSQKGFNFIGTHKLSTYDIRAKYERYGQLYYFGGAVRENLKIAIRVNKI